MEEDERNWGTFGGEFVGNICPSALSDLTKEFDA